MSNYYSKGDTKVIKAQEAEEQTIIEGVTVVLNDNKNGVELYFNDKPSEKVRNNLKTHGFRWSKFNKCWYTKQSEDSLNFAYSLNSKSIEDIKEVSEEYKKEKELKIKEELKEININDIESYIVSKDIQRRLENNSWAQQNDKTKQIQSYFNEANNEAIELLNSTDNINIKYDITKALQRFKRDYYNNFIKELTHRANNPTWLVTGRNGRSATKDNKMNNKYNNIMKESSEILSKYNKSLRVANTKIKNDKQVKDLYSSEIINNLFQEEITVEYIV